jgi:membrane protein DedA with SNARE-associated domain
VALADSPTITTRCRPGEADENQSVSLPQLLTDYGYLAVFVGSVLEGETLLVLAGFAAHQGYLSLHWVVVLAFCGGTLGDQIYFFLGRRYGETLLRRFPRLSGPAQRVNRLLLRYHAGLIIGVRFMYGLRIVGPIVIGTADVPAWRFVLFNVIGAAIWAVTITALGFLFGRTLQLLIEDVKQYEEVALLLIVGMAALIGLAHWLRLHRKKR